MEGRELEPMLTTVYKTERRGVAQPGSAPRSEFSPGSTTTPHQFHLSFRRATFPCYRYLGDSLQVKKVKTLVDFCLVRKMSHVL